jgi:hypothetical protein
MNRSEIEQLLQRYPDRLTVNEVAAMLRVHPRSIRRWACDRRFAPGAGSPDVPYPTYGCAALAAYWQHPRCCGSDPR